MNLKVLIYVLGITSILSCNQQTKDKGIKEMIASAAKEEIAFAAVNYSVANGVVTLSGHCATDEERSKVETTVKQTAGVKQTINQIMISPVTLDGEHLLKQSVDSVVMKYPTVNAVVQDSIIYLQGQGPSKDIKKIRTDLASLGAKGIRDELMIANR
jgi:hypothetical protein